MLAYQYLVSPINKVVDPPRIVSCLLNQLH
jgi:hypothetical protein